MNKSTLIVTPRPNPDLDGTACAIEVVDHRAVNEADKFQNAKIQIEMVGSAATLIAEKFLHATTSTSPESAALLYSAIISNTINFQANVTTDRDIITIFNHQFYRYESINFVTI